MQPEEAGAVLEFWFADGMKRGWPSQDMSERWFLGGPELDREIEQRFGDRVREAVAGGLTEWEHEPLTRLALVVLLDQFTRNVFRGGKEAFAGDDRAQRLAVDALDRGLDQSLPPVGRVFMLMPLMHAEDIELQRRCVREFESLVEQAEELIAAELRGNLRFAKSHLEIIERFGRFPYRNAALGRASSEAELEFIEHGPRFGQ